MQLDKVKNTSTEEDLLLDAERVFSKGLVNSIRKRGHDFIEQGGKGSFLLDSQGNNYIDCLTSASTYNLGRNNRAIIDELQLASRQTDQGLFVTTSEEKVSLAKSLSAFVPGPLNCMLMQVTRGEPFDGACKLARGYTGRSEIIALKGSWFGQTGFAVSLTDREDRQDFGSIMPDTKIIEKDNLISNISKNTAAVIVEPIQVESHCRLLDPNYLRKLREACDKHGTLLIFDETQTGFGRTGSKFAFEALGVNPDILILGEAITNGVFPMAGIMYTEALKQFFEGSVGLHISTFGGHDVGCRVACKAIAEYERVKPWDNASIMGDKLLAGLKAIIKDNPQIFESVQGIGLLTSLKLKTEKLALDFCASAKKSGIIVMPALLDKKCVLLRPTLTITNKEVEIIIHACKLAAESVSNNELERII